VRWGAVGGEGEQGGAWWVLLSPPSTPSFHPHMPPPFSAVVVAVVQPSHTHTQARQRLEQGMKAVSYLSASDRARRWGLCPGRPTKTTTLLAPWSTRLCLCVVLCAVSQCECDEGMKPETPTAARKSVGEEVFLASHAKKHNQLQTARLLLPHLSDFVFSSSSSSSLFGCCFFVISPFSLPTNLPPLPDFCPCCSLTLLFLAIFPSSFKRRT